MVILGINDDCNFNCLFCLDKDIKGKGRPSLPQIKRIFERIEDAGEDTVMFMRGETLLRKDLTKVLELARKHGLKVFLTTNGSLLSSFDLLNEIIEKGVCRINFSVHSHVPRVANALARFRRCFDLQNKALINVDTYNRRQEKKDRIRIGINTVVCRPNYRHLVPFVKYLNKTLSHTPFTVKFKCMVIDQNNLNMSKSLAVHPLKARLYLLDACRSIQRDRFEFSGFPLCAIPGYEWASVELKEMFCRHNSYLNSDEDVRASYLSSIVQNEFFKYDECGRCSLKGICFGIRSPYGRLYKKFDLEASTRNPSLIIKKVLLRSEKRAV